MCANIRYNTDNQRIESQDRTRIVLRNPVACARRNRTQLTVKDLALRAAHADFRSCFEIYVDKFQNSFLVKPESHDGPTKSDHAAGDCSLREKHRSQPHWKYAAERIQLRQVTPIPSDRSQSAAMHISRMPAAVTGVLRNPATPSLRTFPPFMICDPDERKNTFHGRMLRTGLGRNGLWTARRNRSRRPWRSGAGGRGRCMVLEGDLPVVGGGGRRLMQGRRWTGKSLPCIKRLPPRPMKKICQIANPAKHESGKFGRPAATGLMNASR